MNKTHFVFDLDDTLTDSYDFNQQMFVDTFKPYLELIEETEAYLRHLHRDSRGKAMSIQFEEALTHFSLKHDPFTLMKENEVLHIAHVDCIKVFDSTVDFIRLLKEKNKIVSIMSNRQIGSLTKIIQGNGLTEFIDNLISCGDAGHDKPDPYCILELIKESGRKKDEFIYFGDSKTDFEFATNAGVDCVIIDHYINQKKYYKLLLTSLI